MNPTLDRHCVYWSITRLFQIKATLKNMCNFDHSNPQELMIYLQQNKLQLNMWIFRGTYFKLYAHVWVVDWRLQVPPSFPLRLLRADHPECLAVYSNPLVVWCNCAALHTSQHNGTWRLLTLIKWGMEMALLSDSFNRDGKPTIIQLKLPNSLSYIISVVWHLEIYPLV